MDSLEAPLTVLSLRSFQPNVPQVRRLLFGRARAQSSECIPVPVDENGDGGHDAKPRSKSNKRPKAELIARSIVAERQIRRN